MRRQRIKLWSGGPKDPFASHFFATASHLEITPHRLPKNKKNKPVRGSISVLASWDKAKGTLSFKFSAPSRVGSFSSQTYRMEGGNADIGKFLAFARALAACQREKVSIPIYCDSVRVKEWIQAKKCGVELMKTDANSHLLSHIAYWEDWLAHHT